MEPASNFDAQVIVSLDAEAMAGRPGYRTGIAPNHRIRGRDMRYFIGALFFEDRQLLRPGESATAKGKFIVYKADLPLFEPGFRWELCEGVKFVGTIELVSRGPAEDVPSVADLADDAILGSDAPDLNL